MLLVGDSSVGKTRALFEAVEAVIPDWWLLHPRDAEALRAFAAQPTGRTVVWLDELQDYLDHPAGVSSGQVRELIAAGVVLVATCWPGEHSKRVALPEDGRPDPYANDRRLLDLADVLHVPSAFSPFERRRAEDLAGTDHRIRVALDTPDAGFTQVMAAGPDLIRHWTEAPAYAQAVIIAALDARRVGTHAPLTRDYLADAAPSYLNERQKATAPSAWLDDALNYATQLLHGATAALTPVSAGMGTIDAYQVADYLHQHALQARRREPLPDAAWNVLIRHHHPDDTGRLADSAERRGRDDEAFTLFQQLADRGDENAARHLAQLLVENGQIAQLRDRSTSDRHAANQLVRLLAKQEQVDELRQRADNGHAHAAVRLAELLAAQEQVDDAIQVLRPHAGNGVAAIELADLLSEREQIEDAIEVLRAHADNGDEYVAERLVDLLVANGQVERLRVRADGGDEYAATELAGLLVAQGQVEDAIQVLRPHADNGDGWAAVDLAALLVKQEQVEDATEVLRPHADNADPLAATRLAEVLAAHGQVGQLRQRADDGDEYAAGELARLMALQGQVEQLRERADGGDEYAATELAALLVMRDQAEDAIQVLRPHADNGDRVVAARLAALLVNQGRVEDAIEVLLVSAMKGDQLAVARLAQLAARGSVEHAIAILRDLADNGHRQAALELTNQLVEHGKIDELEREVAAGTEGAVAALRRVRPVVATHGG
ncbi:hypothetical protein [Amycolatopsis vastitatis]|uniref:Tetratricopeptide repeat protein n=1 Tax=Amycolatopsis vastitatis TaxID=1905142 RepID=A0A229SLP7_9PSEU|nr:hypothetical protein [Amycolatopsis vastitatis]OXM59674.1 hypothetical protein CF165_46630 [Amycolatopsis vastitatis]